MCERKTIFYRKHMDWTFSVKRNGTWKGKSLDPREYVPRIYVQSMLVNTYTGGCFLYYSAKFVNIHQPCNLSGNTKTENGKEIDIESARSKSWPLSVFICISSSLNEQWEHGINRHSFRTCSRYCLAKQRCSSCRLYRSHVVALAARALTLKQH